MDDVRTQPRFERPIMRTAAALAALSLLFWVISTLDPAALRSEGFASAVLKLSVITLVPLAVACALGWWSWVGFAASPQPRWITGVLWGVGAGFLWAFGGTLLLILWSVAVRGEAAGNLVGLIPFLSSPIGFTVGFAFGWMRSGTDARAVSGSDGV